MISRVIHAMPAAKHWAALLCLIAFGAQSEDFRIQDFEGIDLVVFHATGDISIAVGTLMQGAAAELAVEATTSEFVVENAAGSVVARIPSDTGNFHIAGGAQPLAPGPLNPPPGSFIIVNSHGDTAAFLDPAGNLVARGQILVRGRPATVATAVVSGPTARRTSSTHNSTTRPA